LIKTQKVDIPQIIPTNQKNMKKDGIVEAVQNAAGIETKKQAQEAVEAMFDTIVKTLGRGEEVAITGFGTFRVVKRAARMGVNPKTGEKIQIAASTKPKFRAGKLLKEAVA
jgi:DNA-binding protein HU-beta